MIVFISGSSKMKHLSEYMTGCLDTFMSLNASFIVGDCYGADELAQKYLKSKNYEDVTVYCSQEQPHKKRCKYDKYISLWGQAQGKEGEEFYQVKDKAMCEACDVAVMFWNGASYGVKCNILRCIEMGKTCHIYLNDVSDDGSAINEVIEKSKENTHIHFDKVSLNHVDITALLRAPYKVKWIEELNNGT